MRTLRTAFIGGTLLFAVGASAWDASAGAPLSGGPVPLPGGVPPHSTAPGVPGAPDPLAAPRERALSAILDLRNAEMQQLQGRLIEREQEWAATFQAWCGSRPACGLEPKAAAQAAPAAAPPTTAAPAATAPPKSR